MPSGGVGKKGTRSFRFVFGRTAVPESLKGDFSSLHTPAAPPSLFLRALARCARCRPPIQSRRAAGNFASLARPCPPRPSHPCPPLVLFPDPITRGQPPPQALRSPIARARPGSPAAAAAASARAAGACIARITPFRFFFSPGLPIVGGTGWHARSDACGVDECPAMYLRHVHVCPSCHRRREEGGCRRERALFIPRETELPGLLLPPPPPPPPPRPYLRSHARKPRTPNLCPILDSLPRFSRRAAGKGMRPALIKEKKRPRKLALRRTKE